MTELYHVSEHVQLPLFVFTKVCKSCNPPTEKPIEEFDRDRSHADGYASRCKVCAHVAYVARYRAMHPVKEREKLPPEQEAKRERELARMREYRLKNLEWDRARKRAYHSAHREEKNAKQRAEYRAAVDTYRAANPLPVVPEGYKICPSCKKQKVMDDFYREVVNPDGRKYICKECSDRRSGYKHIGKKRDKPSVDPGYKWCFGCKSAQPLSNFMEDKTKWDGLRPRCNDCHKAWSKEYWQENREHLLPENRERLRNLYERNKEYYRARNREKRKKPGYRVIAMRGSHRRRARKRGATISVVDYNRILARDGRHCYICDKEIDPQLYWRHPASLVYDHVVPLARGGAHSEDNIKPVHRVCNERKNVRLLEEMTPHQRRGPDC